MKLAQEAVLCSEQSTSNSMRPTEKLTALLFDREKVCAAPMGANDTAGFPIVKKKSILVYRPVHSFPTLPYASMGRLKQEVADLNPVLLAGSLIL